MLMAQQGTSARIIVFEADGLTVASPRQLETPARAIGFDARKSPQNGLQEA